jgi:pimeloyl-ACP methyl ester carboxylesterase
MVRIDVRGTGLSDRPAAPGTDPVHEELRLVLGRLGIDRYAIAAQQSLAPAAIIYAAAHPDEVTALVLVDPALRVLDMVASPQLTAVMVAANADWTIASEVIGRQVFGIGRQEAQAFGAYIRSCITPQFYGMALQAAGILDATVAAEQVKAPTLVVRHEAHPYISAEIARDVTSSIPGASQVTTPGLWADDPVALTDRVLAWLLDR